MDFKTRKTYYNRCDPFEPLDPEDARNVDPDDLGSTPVRGDNWVERLASAIELSDKPVRVEGKDPGQAMEEGEGFPWPREMNNCQS